MPKDRHSAIRHLCVSGDNPPQLSSTAAAKQSAARPPAGATRRSTELFSDTAEVRSSPDARRSAGAYAAAFWARAFFGYGGLVREAGPVGKPRCRSGLLPSLEAAFGSEAPPPAFSEAKAGHPAYPICGTPPERQTADSVACRCSLPAGCSKASYHQGSSCASI
ncbi:hypothetical protein GGTG_13327 [Gaeumannomyces tritici R3-111a-1]|uniref:Uncharacterized protein n=1 Tax=Gaeumannomyces tritici (strain R3-111a-1) TaxID=644352 RepID=J3PIJ8_GAET3|nr:hypothetical protein GGTG_13327 [Gaeumannomyces tritici R3-111a-1]EJT69059.1 hypothetical protein GGTG_13327 [Gaeumannomyces tritici R3-111a-1]